MRGRYEGRSASADLVGELACTWTTEVTPGGMTLVPDGCLDLLWLDDGRFLVCGPETRAWSSALPPGTTAVGVRFRPGVAPSVLGVPAVALRETRVAMTDLWGAQARRLADRIGEAPDPAARISILETIVRRRLASGPPVDPVAVEVATRLSRRWSGGANVAALAADLGLSERQLHRRSMAAFGYGPSVLARILRLQRFLAVARTRGGGLGVAALAAAAGYADQPHLSRECRMLAGVTPSMLLARQAGAADVRSVHDTVPPPLDAPAPRQRSA